MELVEVLHVTKNDMLFINDPWWDLLHATGHLPQICLNERKRFKLTDLFTS